MASFQLGWRHSLRALSTVKYAPEDCVLVVDELMGNICGLQDRAVEEPSRALVDEHVRDRIMQNPPKVKSAGAKR